MRKVLIFSGGFVAGIVATILVAAFLFGAEDQPDDGLLGLTVFPEIGECITTKGEIVVFYVLKPNMALAYSGDFYDTDRITVLLVNYNGKSYYDEQKIKVPNDKCARQMGTYKYTTKMDENKTVPVVVIE